MIINIHRLACIGFFHIDEGFFIWVSQVLFFIALYIFGLSFIILSISDKDFFQIHLIICILYKYINKFYQIW
ncbi:hypothetical protein CRX48_03455 [Morganella morganii]|nr:hypothetical protein AL531_18635 [Morganella morganii]PHH07638.1 hypothetical protein CRX48_03455 [Morganella morganii]